jgi:hypothetical protein
LFILRFSSRNQRKFLLDQKEKKEKERKNREDKIDCEDDCNVLSSSSSENSPIIYFSNHKNCSLNRKNYSNNLKDIISSTSNVISSSSIFSTFSIGIGSSFRTPSADELTSSFYPTGLDGNQINFDGLKNLKSSFCNKLEYLVLSTRKNRDDIEKIKSITPQSSHEFYFLFFFI